MKSLGKVTLLLATGLFTSYSFATDNDHGFYVWADVLAVDPVVATHYEEVPVTHCRVEKRHPVRRDHHRRDRDGAMPALLGGLIGGAIGNRIGDGGGRRAMTVIGAIAGAGIASSAAREHRYERVRGNKHRVCETRYELESTEVVEGYQVTYRYLGREFIERTEKHPGDRMKIYVTVAPVDLAHI